MNPVFICPYCNHKDYLASIPLPNAARYCPECGKISMYLPMWVPAEEDKKDQKE